MYDYRKMKPEDRTRIVEWRKKKKMPLHSPPHGKIHLNNQYLVSAACYEHKPVIGKSIDRMTECESEILSVCQSSAQEIYAWCILPNHYHLLVKSDDIKTLSKRLGRFHGAFSFRWNQEDGQRGRQVWYRCFDRAIRTVRHFWVTINYIHHNPVHHGYVIRWQDWIWSSASEYLKHTGRDQAMKIWQEYPILDYGKKWDV